MSLERSETEESVAGFKAGSSAKITHTITADDIRRFVEITGDDNPVHVDRAFAAKTQLKDVVAHGMLSASFISTMIGKHIPGHGALWISQSLEFLIPVRIGDTLSIKGEVIAVHKSQSLLTLKIEIENQHRQMVLKGESKVKALQTQAEPKALGAGKHKFEDGCIVITGGNSGIGAATARLLAASGHKILICYRSNEAAAQDLVRTLQEIGGKVAARRADLTRAEDIRALVDFAKSHFVAISAIVNCATAKPVYLPFEKTPIEEFEHHLSVEFFGTLHLVRACLPHLEKTENASVVNLSTINTDSTPSPHLSAYTAAKAAMASLTRSLAVEYGPKGVRFNLISPGMTETTLIADVPEKARLLTKMQTPLRKLAQPEDVASAIAFMISRSASHITGETLRVCGGTLML